MKWKIQLRDAFIFAAPGAPHSKKWTLFLLFAHFSLENDTFTVDAAAASVDAESNHTFSINIRERENLDKEGKNKMKVGEKH